MEKINRRKSRVIALQAVFYCLSRKNLVSSTEALDFVQNNLENLKNFDEFSSILTNTVLKNLPSLKITLKTLTENTQYEKIVMINRVILLLGMTEMRFFETPKAVIINEYIEIAKIFGEKRSGNLINGVLDTFRKNLAKKS